MVVDNITAEKILSAKHPNEIFSMDPNTIDQQRDLYLARFKPEAFNTVHNFMVTQHIIMLYRRAISMINGANSEVEGNVILTITTQDGVTSKFNCHYHRDIKVATMYVSDENIIFVLPAKNELYYQNYISKVSMLMMFDDEIEKLAKNAVPSISKHFQDKDGDFVIILDKPDSPIYPLREIIECCHGNIPIELVASILNRLYFNACFINMNDMVHNGITLDTLFFAPGRFVENESEVTSSDFRIVGLYGGWFFTTLYDEKISGVPHEVYELLPADVKSSGYSSHVVDALAIRSVALQLFDATSDASANHDDETLTKINAFKEWFRSSSHIGKNAYEEYSAYENLMLETFGTRTFVQLDLSSMN